MVHKISYNTYSESKTKLCLWEEFIMSFIRTIKELRQEHKYRRQRAKRGWSVKDTRSIDYWFLEVMPQMLEYLKEHHMGFPGELQKEYVEAHSDELKMSYEEYCSWPADENSEGYKLREKRTKFVTTFGMKFLTE